MNARSILSAASIALSVAGIAVDALQRNREEIERSEELKRLVAEEVTKQTGRFVTGAQEIAGQ